MCTESYAQHQCHLQCLLSIVLYSHVFTICWWRHSKFYKEITKKKDDNVIISWLPSIAEAPLAGSSPRPPDDDSDVGNNVADADSVADTDGDSVADADGDSVAESSDNPTFSAVFP